MANFFNEITAPQLNSTEYGQGIQDMVNTINNNFQKVFTLPFLKGDDGDMISTKFCSFWVKNDGDTDYYLTQEGAKIFNTIFEKQISIIYSKDEIPVFKGCEYDENGGITNKETTTTYNEFKTILCEGIKEEDSSGNEIIKVKGLNLFDSTNTKEYNKFELFENLYGPFKNPKILLFYKISSEDGVSETPLGSAQLYYYFDPRIDKLSELITINNNDKGAETYRETFEDYTCILSTKYGNDGSYTYEKQSGWPTLYFDNNTKQFCWSINGQKTGVNAQGVNGKDGTGARIWMCEVELDTSTQTDYITDYINGSMSRFKITKVFVPKDSQWKTPDDAKQSLGETNYFQQGDMAVCYIEHGEPVLISVPKKIKKIKKDENGEVVYENGEVVYEKDEEGNYVYEKDEEGNYVTEKILKIFADQMIGIINQNSNDKTFFIQSSISQNSTNTYKNITLFNLLNSIGSDGNPMMKGIFIPTHDNNNKIHALYEGEFNGNGDKSGDLYLVKTDTDNIKTNGGYILHEYTTKPNFNVYYNTNIYGELNVSDVTTLNSGLNVTGTTTLNSGLNVTGTTTLGGQLTVSTGGASITGNLSATGVTTLTNSSREVLKIKTSASSNDPYIQFLDKNNSDYKGGVGISSSTTHGLFLQYNNSSSNKSVLYLNNKYFYPMNNDTYSLGTSNYKWSNVYATTFNGTTFNGTTFDSGNNNLILHSGVNYKIISRIGDKDILSVEKNDVIIHNPTHIPCIEMKSDDPFIDFKCNNSANDYTARIIQWKNGDMEIINNKGEINLSGDVMIGTTTYSPTNKPTSGQTVTGLRFKNGQIEVCAKGTWYVMKHFGGDIQVITSS